MPDTIAPHPTTPECSYCLGQVEETDRKTLPGGEVVYCCGAENCLEEMESDRMLDQSFAATVAALEKADGVF